MQYQEILPHAPNGNAGRRTCIVWGSADLTDMRNQICKSETGAVQGEVFESANYSIWYYQ